jgi:hypothetical protein
MKKRLKNSQNKSVSFLTKIHMKRISCLTICQTIRNKLISSKKKLSRYASKLILKHVRTKNKPSNLICITSQMALTNTMKNMKKKTLIRIRITVEACSMKIGKSNRVFKKGASYIKD